MDDFIDTSVTGYAEWLQTTPNYWALPASGDVMGWTYRKDGFDQPKLQTEFENNRPVAWCARPL